MFENKGESVVSRLFNGLIFTVMKICIYILFGVGTHDYKTFDVKLKENKVEEMKSRLSSVFKQFLWLQLLREVLA